MKKTASGTKPFTLHMKVQSLLPRSGCISALSVGNSSPKDTKKKTLRPVALPENLLPLLNDTRKNFAGSAPLRENLLTLNEDRPAPLLGSCNWLVGNC